MANPDDHDSGGHGKAWLGWAAAAAFLYLLPFVAVMIDEKVLRTFWFSHHLPDELGEVLRAMMALGLLNFFLMIRGRR